MTETPAIPETPIRRWAAAHAATVQPPASRHPAPAPPALPASPAPMPTAASLTLRARWKSDGQITSVSWGDDSGGQPLLATAHYHAPGTGGFMWTDEIWSPHDSSVRLWNPDGQLTESLPCAEPMSVSWGRLPDHGSALAIVDSREVRIWPPGSGRKKAARISADGFGSSCRVVAWGSGPDDRPLLAASGWSRYTRIWDPRRRQTSYAFPRQDSDRSPVIALAWGHLPGGSPVLAEGTWKSLTVWDLGTGEAVHASRWDDNTLRSVACSPRHDGPVVLATGHNDGTARVWTHRHGTLTADIIQADADGPVSVAWAPLTDGRLVLATSTNRKLRLWNGSTRLPLSDALGIADGTANDVAWTLTPEDTLLLAVASEESAEIGVYDVTLESPARPPARTQPRPAADPEPPRPATLLDPPQEITSRFALAASANQLDCITAHDGHVLLATCPHVGGKVKVQVWDLLTGDLITELKPHSSGVRSVAWARMPDGATLLAASLWAGGTVVWSWDRDDGIAGRRPGILQFPDGGGGDLGAKVSWAYLPHGHPLLATANHRSVTVWSPVTRKTLHTIRTDGVGGPVTWGHDSEGRLILVTRGRDVAAQIWDPVTGRQLGTFSNLRPTAWGRYHDGRSMVAAMGGNAGTGVGIWDPRTERLVQVLTREPGTGATVVWGPGPSAGHLLATTATDGSVSVFDTSTGSRVAVLPHEWGTPAWAVSSHGDVFLVVPDPHSDNPPARVWRIAIGSPSVSGGDPDARGGGMATVPVRADRHSRLTADRRPRPTAAVTPLLRLGMSGLWLPLGLLDDLIALTGPTGIAGVPGSTDPGSAGPGNRLGSLDGEPGVARLRALGWPADARAALAALLAGGMAIPAQYTPPPSASPGTLRNALHQTLNGTGEHGDHDGPGHGHGLGPGHTDGQTTAPRWTPPVPELRSAAAEVTDQTATLLRILGPAACTADPLLPLRLAHRIAELPALSSRELTLIGPVSPRRRAAPPDAPATVLAHMPGAADVTRAGPLTRLLPAELASPRDLMSVRLAGNQALYRRHEAPAPPAPPEVTIVLDTTPPTWGPAGIALRLAAHHLVIALWEHGRRPHLVTLGEPGAVSALRDPPDLLRIWTATTLDPPDPALSAATRTAHGLRQPIVLCTHHHTAADSGYAASAGTRLLTSHHTPERPPAPTAAWHAHIPPGPTRAQVTRAVGRLLGGHTEEAT